MGLLATGTVLVGLSVGHYAIGYIAQRQAPIRPGRLDRPAPPVPGAPLARLRIPGIGLDAVVLEGTSSDVLRRGPGHLSGTEMPEGTRGYNNCVIAAHRDSFFRRLGQVHAGDRLLLDVGNEERTYRFVRRRIVPPSDVAVAGPTPQPRVTLITCYPFHWIGHAPYRFILEAELLKADRSPSRSPRSFSGASVSNSLRRVASR
jgi:LPXTG-site transpeptidase (sortase) family protein